MADNIHQELVQFVELVRSGAVGVTLHEQSTKELEQYVADPAYREKFASFVAGKIGKVESKMGISVNDDQQLTFSLFSAYLRWVESEPGGGDVSLKGGFKFNQARSMLKNSTDDWRDSYQDFLKYEKPSPEDQELFSKLTWFESPTFPGRAPLTSYYGCVLPNKETFPDAFYFYDGGVVYPLPFKTYEAYILALTANAGVDCWQYFYVDPALIVQKNKGLNYMTTQLRIGTRLVENMKVYEYDASYEIDRLDLIHEYLQRIQRVLPEAFPDFDLAHQATWLQKLEELL